MLKELAAFSNWNGIIGFTGTPNEYSYTSHKYVNIYRPPLTFEQTKLIYSRNFKSHFPG